MASATLLHQILVKACTGDVHHRAYKNGIFASTITKPHDVLGCLDHLIGSKYITTNEQSVFRAVKERIAKLMASEEHDEVPYPAAELAACFITKEVVQPDQEDHGACLSKAMSLKTVLRLSTNLPASILSMAKHVVVKGVQDCKYRYWDRSVGPIKQLDVYVALKFLWCDRSISQVYKKIFGMVMGEVRMLQELEAYYFIYGRRYYSLEGRLYRLNYVQGWLLPLIEVFRNDAVRRGGAQPSWPEIAMLESLC